MPPATHSVESKPQCEAQSGQTAQHASHVRQHVHVGADAGSCQTNAQSQVPAQAQTETQASHAGLLEAPCRAPLTHTRARWSCVPAEMSPAFRRACRSSLPLKAAPSVSMMREVQSRRRRWSAAEGRQVLLARQRKCGPLDFRLHWEVEVVVVSVFCRGCNTSDGT